MGLRDASIVSGAKMRDTSKSATATATLGSLGDLGAIVNSQASTRSPNNAALVGASGIAMAIARSNTLNLKKMKMSTVTSCRDFKENRHFCRKMRI